MNLFEKLFGRTKLKRGESSEDEERGKFMPAPEMPVDDKFLINFKENGGKFLYCTDQRDVETTFEAILDENDWADEVYCMDNNLKNLFNKFDLNFTNNGDTDFGLLTCEYLIADTGAILLSSNQVGEKKPNELPKNLVVFAGTSQLIENLSDGLRLINTRRNNLPTNIRAIKNFDPYTESDGHFMNYGSTSKNLYLLLLEDL